MPADALELLESDGFGSELDDDDVDEPSSLDDEDEPVDASWGDLIASRGVTTTL